MKGKPLEKPPPLLLPPANEKSDIYPKRPSFKEKGNSSNDKPTYKFTTRYDMFQGILKRVSDMKLNGSLDSEEPSTESEKSECSASKITKGHLRCGSSLDERSNASGFEDESSASSITGSDQCPPYEEIPRFAIDRYSCFSLSSAPSCRNSFTKSNNTHSSSRESFPPPPSPVDVCVRRNLSSEYKEKEGARREGGRRASRPTSLCYQERNLGADVNDNCTNNFNKRLSLEESKYPESIADNEKHQLEMFFRSLKTEVFVCGSLANLYFGWKDSEGKWTYKHTGIVVVILDSGDTRSRRKRRIQILLAERGTCFPLWKDTIDNLSGYHKSGTAFHTMHLSSDHRQIVGFSFDSPLEAEKLIKYVEELTSNPENINISVPGSKKKKTARKKKPEPLPHKKQISNPCLFQHITSVAAKDTSLYMSLQTLIDSEIIQKKDAFLT